MNRYVIIGVVVAAILGLFFWMGQRNKDNFKWDETYDEKSQQPYGTHIIHEILRGYLPAAKLEDLKKKIAESLPTDGEGVTTANYVFVGDGFFTDTTDVDKLMLFVHNGGRAFISTNAVPKYFLRRVTYSVCDTAVSQGEDDELFMGNYHNFSFSWHDTATTNFKHPQLAENKPFSYSFLYKKRTDALFLGIY